MGIRYLAKHFGFANNNQTWQWLESIGYGKNFDKWENQLTFITTLKLPRKRLFDLDYCFNKSIRQKLISEK